MLDKNPASPLNIVALTFPETCILLSIAEFNSISDPILRFPPITAFDTVLNAVVGCWKLTGLDDVTFPCATTASSVNDCGLRADATTAVSIISFVDLS